MVLRNQLLGKMVKNVMTQAFKIEDDPKGAQTVSAQIAARQHALAEIDRAKFGWYHVRYSGLDISF